MSPTKFSLVLRNFKLIMVLVLLAGCSSQTDNKQENKTETLQNLLGHLPRPEDFKPRGVFLNSFECKVETIDSGWLETFPDGIIPWISIDNSAQELNYLIDANRFVTNSKNAIMIIDYPLRKPVEISISTRNSGGFTLAEIVSIASREYSRIYEEDYQSAMRAVKEDDTLLMNGIFTKGKYGIWGHDISELDLSAIEVWQDTNGEILIYLNVIS